MEPSRAGSSNVRPLGPIWAGGCGVELSHQVAMICGLTKKESSPRDATVNQSVRGEACFTSQRQVLAVPPPTAGTMTDVWSGGSSGSSRIAHGLQDSYGNIPCLSKCKNTEQLRYYTSLQDIRFTDIYTKNWDRPSPGRPKYPHPHAPYIFSFLANVTARDIAAGCPSG